MLELDCNGAKLEIGDYVERVPGIYFGGSDCYPKSGIGEVRLMSTDMPGWVHVHWYGLSGARYRFWQHVPANQLRMLTLAQATLRLIEWEGEEAGD